MFETARCRMSFLNNGRWWRAIPKQWACGGDESQGSLYDITETRIF